MTPEQKQFLENWLEENSFTTKGEPEWTAPVCVHAFMVEKLVEQILKIK